MLYSGEGPSYWWMNQRRCCAKESGSRSGRGRAATAARARPVSASAGASSATVGDSKIRWIGTSAPAAARMRLISRVASREWPPSSKKPLSTPTSSTPSTSAKSAHNSSSPGVPGARPAERSVRAGAGRALRSSLPFGVTGSSGRVTKAAGTM